MGFERSRENAIEGKGGHCTHTRLLMHIHTCIRACKRNRFARGLRTRGEKGEGKGRRDRIAGRSKYGKQNSRIKVG